MKTQDVITNLRLMADTIEELEINGIIAAETCYDEMKVHVWDLKITPASEIIYKERHESQYPWEKSFTHNNIYFFSLLTQEDYDKEKQA